MVGRAYHITRMEVRMKITLTIDDDRESEYTVEMEPYNNYVTHMALIHLLNIFGVYTKESTPNEDCPPSVIGRSFAHWLLNR